jgi:hypothetical protein
MKRLLFVVALCVGGLTACGPELTEAEEQAGTEAAEQVGTTEKALACTPEGYCPSGSYCDWNTGLCRRR